ncbi:hypothetical protein [Gryllotalpicola ginsengisoli]|uniref:hypothetical protein n=1 Tax=Gryllotalpicola ginsengisoli TaxID=444608 RepID=UPI000403CFAC|nr:hypothetical protein [Gryllotalpicola ginsengisoli]
MSDPTAWQRPQYGSGPAWAPPPRPGLLPLRPLTFGQLLAAPFQLLRRNLRALFWPAALIQAVVSIAAAAIVGGAAVVFAERVSHATADDTDAIVAGGVGLVVVAAIIAIAISVIGSGLLQGIVVIEVANGTLGLTPRAGQLWRATRGRRWALIGYLALLSGGLLLLFLVLAALVAALVVPGAQAGGGGGGVLIALGVIIGLIGGAGAAVLAAWLWGRTSLTPGAIMLERAGVRSGISRSWQLTRGGFWRVFGAQFLVIAMCAVAAQIVQFPLTMLYEVALGLVFPLGDSSGGGTQTGLAIGSTVLVYLVSFVIGTVTAIVQAGAAGVCYVDQRMRREGLDLVLARHLEDRQAGRPVGDPFAAPDFSSRPHPTA